MRSVVGVPLVLVACGRVGFDPVVDGAPPSTLGTIENPARTCAALRDAGMPSGVYWLRTAGARAFQVYCEQELNGGGWAMLANSVRRDDGMTTTFWQFGYDDRLKELGTLAVDQNYYNGALYLVGTQYMDVFTDLKDKTMPAAEMTATGINPTTMKFSDPRQVRGSFDVYNWQFAAGWSAKDRDGDADAGRNCAVDYGNVAQHYGACWVYNLGVDSNLMNDSGLDGGVGPHVENAVLTPLGLSLQPDGGVYSQVKRIARFTRW
jgi:hypothetical protein